MRYRKLTAAGDYTFGQGQASFYRDTPEAVAQAVQTRLALFTGEWFLDTTEGTPWRTGVLGKGTSAVYDLVLKERILTTPGVLAITDYSSALNPNTRALVVRAQVATQFGTAQVEATL